MPLFLYIDASICLCMKDAQWFSSLHAAHIAAVHESISPSPHPPHFNTRAAISIAGTSSRPCTPAMTHAAPPRTPLTKHKLALLVNDSCRSFRKACAALFKDTAACPFLLLLDALNRDFTGASVRLVKRQGTSKKVSVRVGDRNLSMGEYDSKEDGDLLEFLRKKYPRKAA